MDKKKILIVNLSKGRTGEMNSKLLGMIFVMKFQAAAMSRANVDRHERPDFCLYVDEFQNYSTDSFADILSEARKYGLNLIVANQFTTQLSDEIRDAVFGNVGTIICLRVGVSDAEFLAKQFAPSFDSDDLQRIPNGNAAVRTLINGGPTQPFSMAGLPPVEIRNRELGEALKQLTAAKYGRPKAIVSKEITERISNVPAPVPAKGAVPSAPVAPKPATGSSFLDDWLQKKQTNSFKTPSSPFKANEQPAAVPTAQPQVPASYPTPTQPGPAPMPQTQQQPLGYGQNPTANLVPVQAQQPPLGPQNQPQTPTQDQNTDSSQHAVDLHNPHTDDHTLKLR